MGTTYSITIINFEHERKNFKFLIDSKLQSINDIFSTYLIDSEISNINKSKSNNIELSDEFLYVLNKALAYCSLVDGSYDITVGPLIELWGFNDSYNDIIPEHKEILNVLNEVGFEYISINDNYLTKKNLNITIDLNSIAKGYAVDEISDLLELNGYFDYLVEIGGEVRTSKNKYEKEWLIGIQHPTSNKIIKQINLNNLSMATSGTYNNYFDYKNVTYSHIMNPDTGYPYKNRTVSATVVSKHCIDSDAFATISMTVDPQEAINLINNIDNIEAYLIEVGVNGQLVEYSTIGFDKLVYK